ncbi:MAG TPA: carboxypeptidase-like regulatory domain-containing protein [Terriglobales bacterium]|nr:carboxypeptidase-like regulatory domain-containing protein [Terriglobales bacterium]
MKTILLRRSVLPVITLISLVLAPLAMAGDKKPAIPESLVSFVVIKDYNGKPIHNAGVVMHPVNDKGKQERGGLELKTDVDGKASFDGIPYGKLRIQVLAQGFQTYGKDYDVNQPTMEITVKMKRPSGQYSIYEDHPGDKAPEEKPKQ